MSTPVSDSALANALKAIATAVEAGVSVGQLVNNPVVAPTLPQALVEPLTRNLAAGASLTASFRATGLLRRHELALIEASERTGRLDTGIAAVAEGIDRRVRDRRALLGSLGYPIFLIAASGVILPLPVIVTGGVLAYLSKAIWLPLIVGAFFGVFGWWLPRLPATDPRREIPRRLARRVPILRAALHRADTAVFARVLGQCVSAGIGMHDALDAASDAVDDPKMRRAGTTAKKRLEAGDRLAEAIKATGAFEPEVSAMIAQGEMSGTVDRVLERLAEQEADAGRRAVRRVLIGIVAVVYTAVVLFIAWRIIAGFIGVIETIEQAVEV